MMSLEDLNNFDLMKNMDIEANQSKWKTSRRGTNADEIQKLLKYIDDSVIGKNIIFYGPYGRRKVIFCDYVESGRSLAFIEDYILKEVLPKYGHISNSTNITSLQSSYYRNEAGDIIRASVNANADDELIFTGHGASDISCKLISALNFDVPPIVFINFSCHRFCITSWRRIGAKIIEISETKEGFIDLKELEQHLNENQHSEGRLIGYFSYASKLTGVLTDDLACTLLLHQYGAFSIWDYTYAAPHLKIDMNPIISGANEKLFYKDAILFSMHQFIGGNQTAGVIVAKSKMLSIPIMNTDKISSPIYCTLNNNLAERYENSNEIDFCSDFERSATIEIIRSGLIMQLRNNVGVSTIMQRSAKITKQMLAHIRTIPEIILLGNSSSLRKLPVFSFLVRHPRGCFLHHNFVCSILNDVFGIQARAGCKCAGRYAQRLLNIDDRLASQYEDLMLEQLRLSKLNLKQPNDLSFHELLRPGFSRISVPYFISEQELAFVMEALKMVATEGWKLLPQYTMNPGTGEFHHFTKILSRDLNRLHSIRYMDGKMQFNERRVSGPGPFPQTYSDCLQIARNLFNRARKMAHKSITPDHVSVFDERSNQIRWFMLPSEAQDLLLGNSQKVKQWVPFHPSNSCSKLSTVLSKTLSNESVDIRSDSLKSSYEINEGKKNVIQPTVTDSVENESNRERCLSFDSKDNLSSNNVGPSKSPSIPNAIPNILASRRTSSLNECNLLNNCDNSSNNTYPKRKKKDEKFRHYVSEVSQEIAKEIKSEIRGVISKVEDVLENSDVIDTSSNINLSSKNDSSQSDDGKSDSISIIDVTEYLVEVSKEMANEVTSEIRDVVSAVDIFITPDSSQNNSYSSGSTEALYKEKIPKYFRKPTLSESVVLDKNFTIENNLLSKTTTNNFSHDSGINLMFHDNIDKLTRASSLESDGLMKKYKLESPNEQIHTTQADNKKFVFNDQFDVIYESNCRKWHSPTKFIWNTFVQAIRSFDMIHDKDRILIFITENPNSISLIHILHQYQCYILTKGITFSIAVTCTDINSDNIEELNVLKSYFVSLGIEFIQGLDQINDLNDMKYTSICIMCCYQKRKMYFNLAKEHNYNVIAFYDNMDCFVEDFFINLCYRGEFKTKKVHSMINGTNIREIQPFVYIREKTLKQFSVNENYPILTKKCCLSCTNLIKNVTQIKQMIAQQEMLIPDLYNKFQTALQPFIGSNNNF